MTGFVWLNVHVCLPLTGVILLGAGGGGSTELGGQGSSKMLLFVSVFVSLCVCCFEYHGHQR